LSCETCQSAREEGELYCYVCWDKLEPLVSLSVCEDAEDAEGDTDLFSLDKSHDEDDSETIDEHEGISEKEAKRWYGQYFDYVGDFIEGVAPVWRSPKEGHWSGQMKAGYVAADKVAFLARKYSVKDLCGESILLYNSPIKFAWAVCRLIWTGEFRNGKALVVAEGSGNNDKELIYEIDKHGNAVKIGAVRNLSSPVGKDGTLAAAFVCTLRDYTKTKDSGVECIIDRKGDYIRKGSEYIYVLCDGEADLAQVFPEPTQMVRTELSSLVRISDGQVLAADLSSIDADRMDLPGGKSQCFISLTKKVWSSDSDQPSTMRSLYRAGHGFIVDWGNWDIEFIHDTSERGEYALLNLLLRLEEEEDADGATWYHMAVADYFGKIIYKYKTMDRGWADVNGRAYVLVQTRRGYRVIGLDGKVLISLPGVAKVTHLKAGYFKVGNAHGQHALMNSAGEFTIPYGRFDDFLEAYVGPFLAILAKRNGLMGYVDAHGRILIPFEYKEIRYSYPFGDSRMMVIPKNGGSFYYINNKNEPV